MVEGDAQAAGGATEPSPDVTSSGVPPSSGGDVQSGEPMDVDKGFTHPIAPIDEGRKSVEVEDGFPVDGSSTEHESGEERRSAAGGDMSETGDGPSKRRKLGDRGANAGVRGRPRCK